MSRFSDAWLRLREPIDAASRDKALSASLANRLVQPTHVIDLATGTGANLRYLSPLLGRAQTWQLIDHDQALLGAIPARLSAWARDIGARFRDSGDGLRIDAPTFSCQVIREGRDLSRELSAIDIPTGSLVTAAALLDLVSEAWLSKLAERCRVSRAAMLLALTYNGEIRFEPSEPEDTMVSALVNRHQSTEKGFGPALGPMAATRAVELFERRGFHVETAHSNWHLGPQHQELQHALIEGWLVAAIEMAPEKAGVLRQWAQRRNERVTSGQSALVVGHTDLVGWPLHEEQSRG